MLLELTYRLLGVEEEDGPRYLLAAARKHGWSLFHIILSELESQGVEFGAASRSELARARTRTAHYEWLAAELTGRLGASLMKGPALARFYPPGVLRTYADLDLVFPDEPALWRAVEWISSSQQIERFALSVIGGQPRHLVVAAEWMSTDPLIDPSYGLDLSTVALTGDLGAAPVRVTLPADPAVAALIAVAEERFQRAFGPRDVVDVAILDTVPLPPLPDMLATITGTCRAPEVVELLTYSAEHLSLGPLGELLEKLRPAAEQETARRATVPQAPASVDIMERLAAGQAVYGFALGEACWRGWDAGSQDHLARMEEFSHGHLLHAPIGDFLLTGGAVVTRESYEAALLACAGYRPAGS